MKKSLLVICSAITIIAIFQSSTTAPKRVLHASGSSVATTFDCTGCHGDFNLNQQGSVTLAGLPTTVVAGKAYTFSVHINNAKTSTAAWGFAMQIPSGTLTTTNTSVVGIKKLTAGGDAYHKTPVIKTDTAFSFANITWTAPTTTGNVTIKVAGLAADNDGGTAGDYAVNASVIVKVIANTPVTIASFDAAFASNKVDLTWVSATEVNVANYDVERSTDGSNYTSVGSVKAVGNSSTLQSYSFSDDAEKLSGTIYYRLKSIDKSGASSYSEVKAVTIKATQSYVANIYPNPINIGQDLKVKYIALKADKVSFSLINALGKRVMNSSVGVSEGTNDLSLNIGHIAPGTYYLSVSANTASTQRLPIIVR